MRYIYSCGLIIISYYCIGVITLTLMWQRVVTLCLS